MNLNEKSIFDPLRKKWVADTPEEAVRNQLIHWLIQTKGIKTSRLASEVALHVNGLKKRADLLIFGKNFEPILLAECKAPSVPINQKTLDQAARYNLHFNVPYLLVTNGSTMLICYVNKQTQAYEILQEFPNLN